MLFRSRYQIKRTIGGGGQDNVYLALDQELDRTVVIKQLKATTKSSEQAELAYNEARTMTTILNTNIVTLFDFGQDEEGWYFIMEYAEGMNLNELAKAGLRPEEHTLIEIARQILNGLCAAHAHVIIHGALKPSNIMVSKSVSGAPLAKIIDFGLAGFKNISGNINPDSAQDVHADHIMGSTRYISPEQLSHQAPDARSDLYALGQLIYFYATSCKNTQNIVQSHLNVEALRRLRPDLNPKLIDWINHLIQKNPSDRPESVVDALANLDAIAETTDPNQVYPSIEQAMSEKTAPIPVKPSPHRKAIRVTPESPPVMPWVIACILILAAGGAIYWLTASNSSNSNNIPSTTQNNSTEEPLPLKKTSTPEQTRVNQTTNSDEVSASDLPIPQETTLPVFAPTNVQKIKSSFGKIITLEGIPRYIKQNPETLNYRVFYTENSRGTVPLTIPIKADTDSHITEKITKYLNQPIRVTGKVNRHENNYWVTVTKASNITPVSTAQTAAIPPAKPATAANTRLQSEHDNNETVFTPYDSEQLKMKPYHLVTLEGTITEFKKYTPTSATHVYLSKDLKNTVPAIILPAHDPDGSIENEFKKFYEEKVYITGRVQVYEGRVRLLIKEASAIKRAP